MGSEIDHDDDYVDQDENDYIHNSGHRREVGTDDNRQTNSLSPTSTYSYDDESSYSDSSGDGPTPSRGESRPGSGQNSSSLSSQLSGDSSSYISSSRDASSSGSGGGGGDGGNDDNDDNNDDSTVSSGSVSVSISISSAGSSSVSSGSISISFGGSSLDSSEISTSETSSSSSGSDISLSQGALGGKSFDEDGDEDGDVSPFEEPNFDPHGSRDRVPEPGEEKVEIEPPGSNVIISSTSAAAEGNTIAHNATTHETGPSTPPPQQQQSPSPESEQNVQRSSSSSSSRKAAKTTAAVAAVGGVGAAAAIAATSSNIEKSPQDSKVSQHSTQSKFDSFFREHFAEEEWKDVQVVEGSGRDGDGDGNGDSEKIPEEEDRGSSRVSSRSSRRQQQPLQEGEPPSSSMIIESAVAAGLVAEEQQDKNDDESDHSDISDSRSVEEEEEEEEEEENDYNDDDDDQEQYRVDDDENDIDDDDDEDADDSHRRRSSKLGYPLQFKPASTAMSSLTSSSSRNEEIQQKLPHRGTAGGVSGALGVGRKSDSDEVDSPVSSLSASHMGSSSSASLKEQQQQRSRREREPTPTAQGSQSKRFNFPPKSLLGPGIPRGDFPDTSGLEGDEEEIMDLLESMSPPPHHAELQTKKISVQVEESQMSERQLRTLKALQTGYDDFAGGPNSKEGALGALDDEERQRRHRRHNRKRKKLGKKPKKLKIKSKALEELEANVQGTMLGLQRNEPRKQGVRQLVAMSPEDEKVPSPTNSSSSQSSNRLLRGFEALLGTLLQLSDELELWSTFGRTPTQSTAIVSADAIKAVLAHAPALNQIFSSVNPILEHFLEAGLQPDSTMDLLMTRAHRLVRLLSEITYRVCHRQEWNARSETACVTLIELTERTTLEIICLFEDWALLKFQMSPRLRRAWVATGHVEELKALYVAQERDEMGMWLFQQLCYEVLIGCDQWCPNTHDLALVCDVAPPKVKDVDGSPVESMDGRSAPIPPAAKYVLDNVRGEPLRRTATMASLLRKMLPAQAIKDPSSIRYTFRKAHLPQKTLRNVLSITSAPEYLNDPESMGMSGVGKTTMAALVASHPDVMRYFRDGVAWVHVGPKELTYARYTQCLRELCSQLVFYEGIPLFAELLHTPGETESVRTRREEGFMVYARDTVAELLRLRNVLVILDDIVFESDLEWFQFGSHTTPSGSKGSSSISSSISREGTCFTLVTTRIRDLLPSNETVEIDLLDEIDAIRLFVTESGHPPEHIMIESKEARAIVLECANHPLAVKSVGRWLSLKNVTSGVISSMEEVHDQVVNVAGAYIDKVVASGKLEEADMLFEIMNLSFAPYINGEATLVIKLCFAAFVSVFCHEEYHSHFLSTGIAVAPMIPMETAELLFQTLLAVEKDLLYQEGSPFYAHGDAIQLIPEALSALGVIKVMASDDEVEDPFSSEEGSNPSGSQKVVDQKYMQIMHFIQHEYGDYLTNQGNGLVNMMQDAEIRWNREFAKAYMANAGDWDSDVEDASRDYAAEMLVSHMLRGELFNEAAVLLVNEGFVRGRLYSLGPENATRRHINDCTMLFDKLEKLSEQKRFRTDPRKCIILAYEKLGDLLSTEITGNDGEEGRILTIEAGRAHFEMGFSLAEKRCWKSAITHWEKSQELLVQSLGMIEFVAAILFNIGIVYSELNDFDNAMKSLKQCLRIRGALHGDEHILYAQTIQKIGDVFVGMSDFREALESYNWALEIVLLEPDHHRVDIGNMYDSIGNIHYSKGEVNDAIQCYEAALEAKILGLGNNDPELAVTYQHIGNCLSDQGKTEDAVDHFREAIRLRKLDQCDSDEREADILAIEGVLHNLSGRQEEGLQCYERSLELLVRKVPDRRKKIADLLHLIGCVYLMNGEHKKAMKLFEESLRTRRKMMGFIHLDVASTLFNMAFLHQTRNRPKKALKCLEEALKIRKLRLPDSEKVAQTNEKIGSLAKALGDRGRAEAAFDEALRIRKAIHGDQHETVAFVYHEMGDLMDDMGDYREAMTRYVEALDIRRKCFGLDHEAVASTLYSMGFTLYNMDESKRALNCFDEALIIRKNRIGEKSKEVGDILNMMGFLHATRGELDEALSLLLGALDIRKYQNDHVKASETLKNIGNVHREKKAFQKALACYEECLSIRREELGFDHDKVADALVAIGNVWSDMDNIDQASQAYQEALTIRSYVHGEKDERVATVLQYMGILEFRSGDIDKAKQNLEDYVTIKQENNAAGDRDYVNVLFIIGNIHKIKGEDEFATKRWTEAYQVAQSSGIAKSNPQLSKVMNNLLNVGPDEAQHESVANQSSAGTSTSKMSIMMERIAEGFVEEAESAHVLAQQSQANRKET